MRWGWYIRMASTVLIERNGRVEFDGTVMYFNPWSEGYDHNSMVSDGDVIFFLLLDFPPHDFYYLEGVHRYAKKGAEVWGTKEMVNKLKGSFTLGQVSRLQHGVFKTIGKAKLETFSL